MSLKLITGSAGCGKTEALFREIIGESRRYPDKTFLVIVPEQFSMQAQDRLTALHPGGAILNIDVLSFNRLAYRVFDELGLKRRQMLDETGKTFILQKILLDLKDDLPYFGRRLLKKGGVEGAKSIVSELMQYAVEPDELRRAADEAQDKLLAAKLRDIATIYETYKARLRDRFVTAEEMPVLLGEVVASSELVRDSVVAFDGFTGFTPNQERLVGEIIASAERVLVTVTYDDALDPFVPLGDDHLFSMSSKMIRSLYRMAKERGVQSEPPSRLWRDEEGRFAEAPHLRFLERHIFRPGAAAFEAAAKEDGPIGLRLYQDPASEAAGCAREIARLIRTEGWRYRDIAVIAGDQALYAPAVRRAFSEEGIPFFIDLKKPLLNNPFVEYLRSAVEACADGYSYDSVFRFLKTGMTDLAADEIDRLENHVLACGIRGKARWRSEWTYRRRTDSPKEDPAELISLNESREKVLALLDPLSEVMAARGATVRQRCAALYRLCVRCRCQEKLAGRKERFEAEGRLALSKEYAQIYSKVMELFDRLVSLLGEETMAMADFQTLLEAGLSEMRVGIVPPGTDQVTVGDVERTRLGKIKALFFIGVNEGAVPKTTEAPSFLTEADRDDLQKKGIALRPTAREQAYIQNFYLYLALTRPSKRLILSYAMGDGTGAQSRPSSLIGIVKRLYPGLEVRGLSDESSADPALLERPADGLAMAASLLAGRDGGRLPDTWYELYGWFRQREAYRPRLISMVKGAAYRMEHDVIGRAAARALYGRQLRGSATKFETFAACPFRYLAQYGLSLAERETFEYTGLDRGNIVHDSLEFFGKALAADGRSWASLTDEERDNLADSALSEAAKGLRIFEDSPRNAYEITRLRRLVRRAAWAIARQLEAGDMEPGDFERDFARDVLTSSRIRLSDGSDMILRGRIDRIDYYDEGNDRYVKVIDYKTGSTSFDLTEVYHGLQLQLVLYMNAALEIAARDGRHPVPAGLFYHRVTDPLLAVRESLKAVGSDAVLLTKLRESGFISLDPAVYRHMDRGIVPGKASEVIPLKINKTGEPDKNAVGGSADDFRTLGVFVRRKAAGIGDAILSGEASAAPYRYSGHTACEYCPYRGVCGFDERLRGCDYRVLRKMDGAEVLLKMKEENELDG